ncbi:MAG: GPW/gp25 family protein [Desulfobulbus sp.]|nr:GPW/gp25 family protein [Desulfobulbus sp.]
MGTLALIGSSRTTGRAMTGMEHLKQSITDIITTPIGSRVMRPEYGSYLPRMVDLPINKGMISALQSEISRAIGRWEPRLKLARCVVTAVVDGAMTIEIRGNYLGEDMLLEVTT